MLSPEAEVGGFFQLGVVDSLGRDLIPIVIVAQGACSSSRDRDEDGAPEQAGRESIQSVLASLGALETLTGRIGACSDLDAARTLVAERREAVAAVEGPLCSAISRESEDSCKLRTALAERQQQRRSAEKLFARLGISDRLHSATDVQVALSSFRRYFETRPRARGAGPLIGPLLTEVVGDLRQLSLDDADMYGSLLRGEEVDPADCESRLRTRQALLLELHTRLDAAEESAYVLGSSVLQWLGEQEEQKQREARAAQELHSTLQGKQEQLRRGAEDELRAEAELSELRELKKEQIKLQTRLNAAKNNLSEAQALDQLRDEAAGATSGDRLEGADTPGRSSASSLKAALDSVEREQSALDEHRRQLIASLRALVQTVPQLRLNPLIASVPIGLRLGPLQGRVPRVSRNLDSDYDQVAEAWVSVSQRVVYTAQFQGERVTLKSFTAGGAAEAEVQRELIVSQLEHPNVMTIQAVFFDASRRATFMQMSACACGSFRQWALGGTKREPWQVQSVGAQVLHALSFLHGAGIVHRGLSPDGILMVSETEVQVGDFCWARGVEDDEEDALDGVVSPYAPPEVLQADGAVTAATSEDMWAFGALMFEAHWGAVPFLLPEMDRVEVTGHSNARLVALLGLCLSRLPSARPAATNALVSPYFTVSLVHDLQQGREVSSSAKRVEAFYAFVEAMRASQDTGSVKEITVDRSSVANVLLEHFGPSWIKRSFRVVFNGEAGADAGGLTTELFRLFFLQVGNDESSARLFDRGSGGCYLPRRTEPDTGDFSRLERLRVFGHVLAKCLLEGRFCAIELAPSFLKFLLDQRSTLTLRDLECFDPEYARQLQRLLVTPEYSEVLDCTFEGLHPGGEDRCVDETNKQGTHKIYCAQTLFVLHRCWFVC